MSITLNAAPTSWASDTNFSSGPDNGTPTKVDPGVGRFAQGWVPGITMPAQHINFELHAITDCLADIVSKVSGIALDGVNGGTYTLVSPLIFAAGADLRINNILEVLATGGIDVNPGGNVTFQSGANVIFEEAQELTIDDDAGTFLLTLTPHSQSFDAGTLAPTWLPLPSAAGWFQHDVGSARQICFPITLPPGDDIVTLTVRVNGGGAGGGHSSLPAGSDRLKVSLVSVAFDGAVTTLATRADQSANVGAYDINHVITLSSGSLDSGSLPRTVNTLERYFVVIAGEHGANAVADTTTITEVKGTCTARSYRAETVVF